MGKTMADHISLGKNGNIGKLDLSRIKAGVKKEQLVKNDLDESVWKKYDKNNNNQLDRDELDALLADVNNLKGDDDNLSEKEVKNFDGQKLGRKDRKALLEFLNKLDGVTPENVEKVETKLVDNKQVEVVTYKDGHTEEYYPNGQKISEVVQGNKKTKTTEMNGSVTSEVITENEGEEKEIISTTSTVNGQKQTVINNKSDKTTTTINYNGDKKSEATIVGENFTSVITYDSEGNPAKEVETSGTTEKTYIYQNGQKVLQSVIENKGLEGKETTKAYDSEGGYTQTKEVGNGKITTVVDKDGNVTSNVKTEKVNGQEVSLQLDKDGNIPGVIVQNGESPAAIAKKFGCSVDELMQLNADQLKGKGKKQYFDVGSEIKLPGSVSIEKFNKASEGRKPAEIAKQEYARDAEIRRQKAEAAKQEREYYQKLGVKNFNNKGQKVKAEGWGNKEFEVIGDVGYGRQLVKRDGKLYTRSHDGKILREDYLQAHKAYVSKPQNQRNNTASGIKDVTYVKDNNGKVWYFDEKTGKAIVKGDYTQIVKRESAFVADQLHKAAKNDDAWYNALGTGVGTDNELLEKGINNIYSADILAGVNAELRTKDSDYDVDVNKTQMMPVEALILDENNHKSARPLLKTLVNSGAMTVQEQARTIKREMEYELAGESGSVLTQSKRALEHFEFGTSYTSTSDLNEIMQMTSNREVRLEIENQYKNDPQFAGLEPNEGSYVRARIGADGGLMHWNAQEVDQFDANWVKTGAYQEARYVKQTDENGVEILDANGQPVYVLDEGDQAHRNGVIGRLVFDYQDKEALNKGLDAVNENPNSFDYQYLDQRAGEEIAKDPQGKYQSRFTNQDNIQRYLAGFHSDAAGNVDAGNVSASNTCLFKGIKPARVQAEEALYNAKNGDYSQTFDSMDSETYVQIAELVANGDINGVKDMTDLYNKALESTKGTAKQQLVKGNAILSGQVQFSDKEIADYCIELMHSIDNNRGTAASSNANSKSMTNGLGGYTNLADTQTEQLKAILQANPQILQSVKQQVENGKFESVTQVTAGIQTKSFAEDTKGKYLDIIADTKSIVKDEVFLDANGNKITDPTQIKAIKEANMQSLDIMRQYVAELERDFKKGVDAEGTLSNMGNAVLEASGLGTDRGDVANEYKQARLMLQQFEAAAQGKLRDSDGNIISAQDLAQQMLDKQNALAQTNSNYKQSVAYAKMGIVMAPVIVATAGAGAAVGVAGGAATAAGMTTTGTILSSTTTTAIAGGFAAGATTYGMNALEYNTSYTGNTAEAREQNMQDSLVNGVTTAAGIGQMKYIGNMANNMGTVARTGIRLGTTVAADTAVGAAAEGITTKDLSASGFLSNMGMSLVGNAIGAKSLGKKQPPPNMHPRDGVYFAQDTPEFTYGNAFKHQESAGADATIAHNSTVKVKDTKAIDAKTDNLINTSTDGQRLAGAHNELDALSNRGTRRSNQAKLDEKARTLTPEEKARYDESVQQHHQQETEHALNRHNELSEADFRTIGNSINDAKTPEDLISLRQNLKQKEYTHGGVTAEYKALEDKIDNKLTEMIRNAGDEELEEIGKQLVEMKLQVQNDARLSSSLEKLNKEIASRKAYLKDQKASVESVLTNGKGIADNNELDKIIEYVKTLDSEQAIDALDVLRRNKKMTGAQKKVLDETISNRRAEIQQTKMESHTREVAAPAEATPAKLTQQNLEQFENLNYQEMYNQMRDRGIKVKTQRPNGSQEGSIVFEDGGKQYIYKFDKDGNFVGRNGQLGDKTAGVDVFYNAQKKVSQDSGVIVPKEGETVIINGEGAEVIPHQGEVKSKAKEETPAPKSASDKIADTDKNMADKGFVSEGQTYNNGNITHSYINRRTGQQIEITFDKNGQIIGRKSKNINQASQTRTNTSSHNETVSHNTIEKALKSISEAEVPSHMKQLWNNTKQQITDFSLKLQTLGFDKESLLVKYKNIRNSLAKMITETSGALKEKLNQLLNYVDNIAKNNDLKIGTRDAAIDRRIAINNADNGLSSELKALKNKHLKRLKQMERINDGTNGMLNIKEISDNIEDYLTKGQAMLALLDNPFDISSWKTLVGSTLNKKFEGRLNALHKKYAKRTKMTREEKLALRTEMYQLKQDVQEAVKEALEVADKKISAKLTEHGYHIDEQGHITKIEPEEIKLEPLDNREAHSENYFAKADDEVEIIAYKESGDDGIEVLNVDEMPNYGLNRADDNVEIISYKASGDDGIEVLNVDEMPDYDFHSTDDIEDFSERAMHGEEHEPMEDDLWNSDYNNDSFMNDDIYDDGGFIS